MSSRTNFQRPRPRATDITARTGAFLLLGIPWLAFGTACGETAPGGGGPIDLGEPLAGVDDEAAALACDALEEAGEPLAGGGSSAEAPALPPGAAREVTPVPAGTTYVKLTITETPYRGALFVAPAESILSATQGDAPLELVGPEPNGHCSVRDMSDYRFETSVNEPIVLELDGDAPLRVLLLADTGSTGDAGTPTADGGM